VIFFRTPIIALGNVKTSFALEDADQDDRNPEIIGTNPLISQILKEKPEIFERRIEEYNGRADGIQTWASQSFSSFFL